MFEESQYSRDSKKDIWQQVIEAVALGVLVVNQEGQILYANDYAVQLFNTNRSELIGTNFSSPLAANVTQEIEVLKANDEVLTIHMTIKKGTWENRLVWVISLIDITEIKLKERLLKVSTQGVSSAFEGIIITDPKGTIIEVNKAFLKMTGFKEKEVVGKNPKMLHSGEQDVQFYKDLWSVLLEKGHWHGEIWDKKKSKKRFPVFLSISAVKNADGEVMNYIGFYHDLTVIKKQEQQIERFKYYDYLTGLPINFYLFKDCKGLSVVCPMKKRISLFLIFEYLMQKP
ncbi:PAS domain-containing protein [Legionella norrlandica]|uniref:PAS domain-containing protein n=1 Tax=Legionella norrlandica TaxID=1498499 RepID=UPI000AC2B564|nr:PAS domain-containing protein [Legionella norrlandica]